MRLRELIDASHRRCGGATRPWPHRVQPSLRLRGRCDPQTALEQNLELAATDLRKPYPRPRERRSTATS